MSASEFEKAWGKASRPSATVAEQSRDAREGHALRHAAHAFDITCRDGSGVTMPYSSVLGYARASEDFLVIVCNFALVYLSGSGVATLRAGFATGQLTTIREGETVQGFGVRADRIDIRFTMPMKPERKD